jgi:hypothetical protein
MLIKKAKAMPFPKRFAINVITAGYTKYTEFNPMGCATYLSRVQYVASCCQHVAQTNYQLFLF